MKKALSIVLALVFVVAAFASFALIGGVGTVNPSPFLTGGDDGSALATRPQLSGSGLAGSFANQSQQAILKLFG